MRNLKQIHQFIDSFNTLGAVWLALESQLCSLLFSVIGLSVTLSRAHCSGKKERAHIAEVASYVRIGKRVNDRKPMKRSHRSLILYCFLCRKLMQNASAQSVKLLKSRSSYLRFVVTRAGLYLGGLR